MTFKLAVQSRSGRVITNLDVSGDVGPDWDGAMLYRVPESRLTSGRERMLRVRGMGPTHMQACSDLVLKLGVSHARDLKSIKGRWQGGTCCSLRPPHS